MFPLNILSIVRMLVILVAVSAGGYIIYDYFNMKKELESKAIEISHLKSSLELREKEIEKEKEFRSAIRKIENETSKQMIEAVRKELKRKNTFEAERLKKLSEKKASLLTLRAKKATEEKFSRIEKLSAVK